MVIKRTYAGVIVVLFIVIVFLRCGKDTSTIENEQVKDLLSRNLPKNVEQDYNLVIRYESKESPDNWKNLSWKKDNDYLEKKGLLKQSIADTMINFYDHKHLKFINQHQYLYKVQISNELEKLLNSAQLRIKRFDEYDRFNRKTGKQISLECIATCGTYTIDEIKEIKKIDKTKYSEIEYTVKFNPTPFNDIINYQNKLSAGESTLIKVKAEKLSPKEVILVN